METMAFEPVLVIEPLRELLAQLQQIERNPAKGSILRGVKSGPLDLNMLAKRVIRPALRNRKKYRDGESKNWKPLEWQGFYPLRRRIATKLTAMTRDPMAAKVKTNKIVVRTEFFNRLRGFRAASVTPVYKNPFRSVRRFAIGNTGL